MSPKADNKEPSSKPDVTVDIPHEPAEPVPTTTPPLPIQPAEPTPQPESIITIPELHEEIQEHEGRRWPTVVMYIVLALLVAAMVVFIGSWIYRKVTNQSSKVDKPVSITQGQVPTPPPVNTPANNQTSPTTPSTTGGQLPNNGPGEVIVVFVATALVVGGLHFLYNLRKQN